MVRRIWAKEVKKKGLGRDELVKVFNNLKIVSDPLNTVMVPFLQTRMNRSYKNNKTIYIYIYISVPHPFGKLYAYKENKQKDAPDTRVPQLQSSLGASSGSSPRMNSQPSPKMKKKLVFQFRRDNGESRTNLKLLPHGLNSQ